MGYTKREAEFLYLVGKHSGVFTVKQFCSFAGISFGGPATALIQRSTGFGHVDLIALRRGSSRPAIYRRSKRFEYVVSRECATSPRRNAEIQTRLKCLDYIIANPDKNYLHTEVEKEEKFRGVNIPVRFYKKVGGGGETVRHVFVDNFPIAVQENGTDFVYVDQSSQKAFRRFLTVYRALLLAIGKCKVVFACNSEEAGEVAAITFRHVMAGVQLSADIATEFMRRDHLEEKLKAGDLSPDDAQRLRGLRDSRFSSSYDAWRNDKASSGRVSACEFSWFILPRRYEFLGISNMSCSEAAAASGMEPAYP
jgi:hypothetical protein